VIGTGGDPSKRERVEACRSVARALGVVVGTDGDVVALAGNRFNLGNVGPIRSGGGSRLPGCHRVEASRFDHPGGGCRVAAPAAMWWRRDPVALAVGLDHHQRQAVEVSRSID
jgi:hypothetical protein